MKIILFFLILVLFLIPSSANVYLKDDSNSAFSCISCDGTNLTVVGNVSALYFCPYNDICISQWNEIPGIGGGGAGDKWIDEGTYIVPNSSYADNIQVNGYIKALDWTNVSITESQISDLSDYNCSDTDSCTNIFYHGNLLDCSDIDNATSDLCTLVDTDTDTTCAVDGSCPDIVYQSELTSGSNYAPVRINLTIGTYDGNLTNDTFTGYKAGNNICSLQFTGAHFCTEFEVTNWFSNTTTPNLDADAWVITGSPKYIPATVPVNDCNGWTYNLTVSYLGNYWHFNSTTGGDGRALNCGTKLKLACCSY